MTEGITALQEFLDRLYFEHGPCCAGCDWWRSMSTQVGDCTKSAPVDGHTRWEMLGIEKCSLKPLPGHIVTACDHVCGSFKDEFDWTTLPLPYRKRIGQLHAFKR
jgi:hypothetical protein